jgi:hypothetical protein
MLKGLGLSVSFGLAVAVALASSAFVIAPAGAQQAKNVAEFCATWRGVCNRTCPQGRGNCDPECNRRLAQCRKTGCFHFNVPRPRCWSNAEDRRLTDLRLAPDPEAARAKRKRFSR